MGTILMPVFALFFPVTMAISLTAVVHLLNSLFRVAILIKTVNREIVSILILPSVMGALLGALLLLKISRINYSIDYTIGEHSFYVTPVKLFVGLLILFYLVIELIPSLKKIRLKKGHLLAGGFITGFFGGLSGHQGMFRSILLLKTDVSSDEYVSSNLVIAAIVDIVRLIIYGFGFSVSSIAQQHHIFMLASISAIIGSILGIKYIKKVTIEAIRIIVSIMLLIIGLALITGVI